MATKIWRCDVSDQMIFVPAHNKCLFQISSLLRTCLQLQRWITSPKILNKYLIFPLIHNIQNDHANNYQKCSDQVTFRWFKSLILASLIFMKMVMNIIHEWCESSSLNYALSPKDICKYKDWPTWWLWLSFSQAGIISDEIFGCVLSCSFTFNL